MVPHDFVEYGDIAVDEMYREGMPISSFGRGRPRDMKRPSALEVDAYYEMASRIGSDTNGVSVYVSEANLHSDYPCSAIKAQPAPYLRVQTGNARSPGTVTLLCQPSTSKKQYSHAKGRRTASEQSCTSPRRKPATTSHATPKAFSDSLRDRLGLRSLSSVKKQIDFGV